MKNLIEYNGAAIDFTLSDLDKFTARLNREPNEREVESDRSGAKYLPISFVQTTLDELFLGLWSWEVKQYQVIANEITVHGELRFFHPVARVWLTRSGVASAIIRQRKDADLTDIGAKIKDSLVMDLPHAEADAMKSAARKIGKIFGRDLNRKFVDQYKRSEFSAEEVEAQTEVQRFAQLSDKFRKALPALPQDVADRFRATANSKREAGKLDADALEQLLAEVKAAKQ